MVTTPLCPREPAKLREDLALLVAEHRPMISRYTLPQLRGTPFTPDDVYSKVQYDIAEGDSWLFRMWEENNGSFDNSEAALIQAAQYVVRSFLNRWRSELRRFTAEDYHEVDLESEQSTDPIEEWIEQHVQRLGILDAVAHAGLTEAEACLVRTQLAGLDKPEADRLLADILRRGDPAEMPEDERKRFDSYRRQIQRRAYAKLRFYLGEIAEGGNGDDE